MFGLLFGLPQYFQAVQGHDPLGSGYRLLSLIGGLMIGLALATALAKKLGSKVLVALGFGLMASGLILGTQTAINSSDAFLIAWVGLTGLGLGFVTPSTANAALGALSPERSSSGSALMTAIRQVGSTLGVAVLGTVLGSTYRAQLHITQLPDQLATAVRSSVVGGTAVARQLKSAELLRTVQAAFVYGLSQMLWICAGIALVAACLP
jgi:Na+/melibiose symporter-like transporter